MSENTFKLILGTPIANRSISPWKYFEVPAIMVNSAEIIKKKMLEKIKAKGGLHKYLEYNGEIYLDSGGFQILNNNMHIPLNRLVKVIETTGADYFFSLDIPSSPSDSFRIREKKRKKTVENYVKLKKKYDSVIPIVQPPPENATIMCKTYTNDMGYDKTISIGGLVPLIMGRGANNSRTTVIKTIFGVRKMCSNPTHVMGIGAPTLIPTLQILDVNFADSTSWRIKAAYGKIMLPSGGERHITRRRAKFGRIKLSEDEKERIDALKCPIIEEFGWEKMKSSFTVRALYNAWVSLYSSKGHFIPHGPLKSLYKYALDLLETKHQFPCDD